MYKAVKSSKNTKLTNDLNFRGEIKLFNADSDKRWLRDRCLIVRLVQDKCEWRHLVIMMIDLPYIAVIETVVRDSRSKSD